MKFLHLTDIHFLIQYPVVETGYYSIFNDMTNPIKQLIRGLKYVSDYDAVLISGDLVEDGNAEDYASMKEIFDNLFQEIPIILALGNHDHKPAFYEGWLKETPHFEPYNHYVTINETTIICLDNSHPNYPNGKIGESHCSWLQETLTHCQSEQIILMMHHHLIEEQFSIPSCLYEQKFVEIVKNSSIDMILCGHTHHAYEGTFATKPYYTADNLSFSGEDTAYGYVRFEERSGFNYCELINHEIKVQNIPIETSRKLLANVKF